MSIQFQANDESRAADQEIWRALSTVAPAMMTTGDSGGPLYCRSSQSTSWVLIGVNSTSRVVPIEDSIDLNSTEAWASSATLAPRVLWRVNQGI